MEPSPAHSTSIAFPLSSSATLGVNNSDGDSRVCDDEGRQPLSKHDADAAHAVALPEQGGSGDYCVKAVSDVSQNSYIKSDRNRRRRRSRLKASHSQLTCHFSVSDNNSNKCDRSESNATRNASEPECTTQTRPGTSKRVKTDARYPFKSTVSDSHTETYLIEVMSGGHATSPSHSPSFQSPTLLDLTAPPKLRRVPDPGSSVENRDAAVNSARGLLTRAVSQQQRQPDRASVTLVTTCSCASLHFAGASVHSNHTGDSNSKSECMDGEESVSQNARQLSFEGRAEERSRSQSDRFWVVPGVYTQDEVHYWGGPSPTTCAAYANMVEERTATLPSPPVPTATGAVAAESVAVQRSATPPLQSHVHAEDGSAAADARAHDSLKRHRSGPASPLPCPSYCTTNIFIDHEYTKGASKPTTPCSLPSATLLEGTFTRTLLTHGAGADGSFHSPSPRRTAKRSLMDSDGNAIPSAIPSYGASERKKKISYRELSEHSQRQQKTREQSPLLRASHGLRKCTSSPLFEARSQLRDATNDITAELSSATLPRTYHNSPTLPFSDRLTSQWPFLTPLKAAEEFCVPQVVPTHDSVFFPLGTAVIAPVVLHYATVGGWSTLAGGRDYFNHRRLRGGEIAGHTVRWLHTAHPRDRFVFMVTPVSNCDDAEEGASEASQQQQSCSPTQQEAPSSAPSTKQVTTKEGKAKWWQSLRTTLFGEAPWFTIIRTGCGSRSRIACDDAARTSSANEAAAASTSGVYEPFSYAFPLTASVGQGFYIGEDDEAAGNSGADNNSLPKKLFASIVETFYLSNRNNNNRSSFNKSGDYCEAEVRSCRATCPSTMSPKPVAQPSDSSVPVYATPVGALAQVDTASSYPTPLSLGLAVPAAAAAAVTAAKPAHGIATSSAANGLFFPMQAGVPATSFSRGGGMGTSNALSCHNSCNTNGNGGLLSNQHHELYRRASASGQTFAFSPLTGTEVSTSDVSPVTPHHPRVRDQQPPRRKAQMNWTPTQSRYLESAASSNNRQNTAAPINDAVLGVEVIEIAHADITAMDYAPRLTSHRLSIEAKKVYTYFFPTLMAALDYYECTEAMPLMEEQWAAGISSQIPRPQCDAPSRQPQQRRKSVEHRSNSIVRTPSLNAHVRLNATRSKGAFAVCQSSRPSGNASPLARLSEIRKRQQSTPSRTASCPSPLSLAGELPSAGGGSSGNNTEKNCSGNRRTVEHCGMVPARLFRPHSFPSLDSEMDTHRIEKQNRPSASALHAHHTVSSLNATTAAAGAEQGKHVDLSPLLSVSAYHHVSNLQSSALSETSSSRASVPHLAPTTPSLATFSPHQQQYHPQAVQPKLTSTHHEIVVSVYSADPVFNSVLRELLMPEPGTHPYTASVAEQKRMLSMVEVGMPAWAVFYSSTGLPYRRLFRLMYSGLTNLWPLLSLTVGVYDLYKHLPQLKRFMERTLDPLTRWLERRFTLRLSVLATYLFSAVVTIFSSLSAFVSQFYVVQLLSLPIVQLVFALVKLPFVLAFDTVWFVASTAFSMISLAFQLVRLLVMAPVVFVVNVASLRETVEVVAPVAVQGTSLSVKWWKAWSEFWETVASPMKNAVRAWWDSMVHVSTSAAKRETTIRRWYTPKVEECATVLTKVQDIVAINVQLWWTDYLFPGLRHLAVLAVTLIYLYWLFLGISDKVWDDFIYASGVRDPATTTAAPVRDTGGGVETFQQRLAAVSQEMPKSMDDEVTPMSAALHILFQSSSDSFASAKNAIIASSTATTTSLLGAPGGLPAAAAATPGRTEPSVILLTPTSVIQMCDSPDGSTITKTSTQTTATAPGAQNSTTHITTITTTVIPPPHASLSALAAELLLPNAVLELLHRVRQLVQGGWGVVNDVAAVRHRRVTPTQLKQEQAAYGNGSRFRMNSSNELPRCTHSDGAGKKGSACFHNDGVMMTRDLHQSPPPSTFVTTVEVQKATPVLAGMRRYVEERLSLVAPHGTHPKAAILEVRPTWAETTYLRWGDADGRETRRDAPVGLAEGSE